MTAFNALLTLLLLFFSCSVESREERERGGTCNAADGDTCASETEILSATICFPDGSCFGSFEEAEINYDDPKKVSLMPMVSPKPLGDAQEFDSRNAAYYSKTLETLSRAHDYMVDLFRNDTASSFRDECKVRHKSCAFWAAMGECEANPPYMILQCAPVCRTCDKLSFEGRCPYDENAPKVWGPGDLNKMFERLTKEEYYVQRFEPTILSQPPKGPWVITLENVATEDQCKRIIELGLDRGFERSKDVGEIKFDGTFDEVEHDVRTSQNTWCLDECYEDEANQKVLQSVENITGIPDSNSEYWQLLQYEETQHYGYHHDYIPFHLERFFGSRILTVFLYLNDVEEGGGTKFSDLGITVQPKTGRAVVWPSVLDSYPDEKDRRTTHEALPVIKGTKYGANAWIHQRSFKEVFDKGCS